MELNSEINYQPIALWGRNICRRAQNMLDSVGWETRALESIWYPLG